MFGWISLDAFILLRCIKSAVVGWGADSNRYTLVLTYDLVSDVGNPFWGITFVEDFESIVSASR